MFTPDITVIFTLLSKLSTSLAECCHTFSKMGVLETEQDILFKFFIVYLFLERRGGREEERDRNIDVGELHRSVASHTLPVGDLAHNPGMCPDCEWNQRPFSSQAGTQSTESQQPKQKCFFLMLIVLCFNTHTE